MRLTDRKRQAIVDAAIAEFREHGFEVANMDRIAGRAQVSKRTVYNHFSGKDALFDAILERLWVATEAKLKLTYRADRPLREQLLTLVEQKLAMSDDPQFLDLARVLIAEAIHAPQRAREMLCRLGGRERSADRVDPRGDGGRPPQGRGSGLRRGAAAGPGQGLRLLAADHDGTAVAGQGAAAAGGRFGDRHVPALPRGRSGALSGTPGIAILRRPLALTSSLSRKRERG